MTNYVNLAFPLKALTKLPTDRAPSALAIRQLKREVCQQALAIPTVLGGGNHGHLGLVLSQAEYNEVGGEAGALPHFSIPNRPTVPDYAGNGYVVAAQQTTFQLDLETYRVCQTVSNELKQQILAAVPSYTLQVLAHDDYGFSNVTVAQMITHLMNAYGTISEDDLADNLVTAEAAWNPDDPIETLINRVTKARAFATAGGDAISAAQAVRITLAALDKSGVMDEALKDWRKKAAPTRLWANIAPHFIAANKERLRSTTAKTIGYSAKAIQKSETDPMDETKPKKWYYCWSQGLSLNPNHTSATCTNPAHGHQVDATLGHMKGGNNTIRRRPKENAVYKRPQRVDTEPKDT